MIARAPGKLVISGAYAVLEGAPALVAAAGRYCEANGDAEATFVTPEVEAAIDAGALDRACAFDASALREPEPGGGSRKLGLGSSAAILVATMLARRDRDHDLAAARAAIFPLALAAHRKAQGGGSGVDVASSTFGGVIRFVIGDREGAIPPQHALPSGVVITVFACAGSASTANLIGLVRAHQARDPEGHRALMDRVHAGARAAVDATSARAFIAAIAAQVSALGELGAAAGAPILTDDVASLRARANDEGASFGPSGAGGGDMAIYVGEREPTAAFIDAASALGMRRVALDIGAEGAHWA